MNPEKKFSQGQQCVKYNQEGKGLKYKENYGGTNEFWNITIIKTISIYALGDEGKVRKNLKEKHLNETNSFI